MAGRKNRFIVFSLLLFALAAQQAEPVVYIFLGFVIPLILPLGSGLSFLRFRPVYVIAVIDPVIKPVFIRVSQSVNYDLLKIIHCKPVLKPVNRPVGY